MLVKRRSRATTMTTAAARRCRLNIYHKNKIKRKGCSLDAQVIAILLLALVVQQDVLARAEAELQDVLLENLNVLSRLDLLVVDERPVGRVQVDDVGRHLAASRPVGTGKVHQSILENCVLEKQIGRYFSRLLKIYKS